MNRHQICAAVGISVIASCAAAHAAEPTRQELEAQLQSLQHRVEQLQQPRQQRASGNGTIASVEADAQSRSQLLADNTGLTAGYDQTGFFIGTDDRSFMLRPGVLLKIRNTTSFLQNGKPGGSDDDFENGFEIRQMKLILSGNAFSKDLSYRMQWDTRPSDGTIFFQDAFVRYKMNEFAIKAGQFRDPVYHESLVWDGYQLANDRALVSFLIGGELVERVQGVDFSYDPSEKLHVNVMYHDGYNTDNTSFQDGSGGSALLGAGTNFGVSGRVQYIAQGTNKMYEDFTAMGNSEDLLAFGGGFDWTQGGSNNIYFHTADVQWEPQAIKGLAVYAAYLGVYRDLNNSTAGAGNFYDWGFIAQAAYMLDSKWEVFARWDYTRLDGAALPAGVNNDVHEIAAGVNYYSHGHHLKFTVDGVYLPNGSPADVAGADVRANDDNELLLRAQVQLYL